MISPISSQSSPVRFCLISINLIFVTTGNCLHYYIHVVPVDLCESRLSREPTSGPTESQVSVMTYVVCILIHRQHTVYVVKILFVHSLTNLIILMYCRNSLKIMFKPGNKMSELQQKLRSAHLKSDVCFYMRVVYNYIHVNIHYLVKDTVATYTSYIFVCLYIHNIDPI